MFHYGKNLFSFIHSLDKNVLNIYYVSDSEDTLIALTSLTLIVFIIKRSIEQMIVFIEQTNSF